MFDERAPPVMRGDLFALLDPDTSTVAVTPQGIAADAQELVQRVTMGERAPGTTEVMRCLSDLARVDDRTKLSAGFSVLSEVRARLAKRGQETSSGLPWPLISERSVVLPQRRSAVLVRAIPTGDGFYVVTREAAPSSEPREANASELEEDGELPTLADAALGPARVPPVDVTFKLFRFGPEPSDIRIVMRVVQEAGTFRSVLCAGDGERFAMLSRDVVGIFDNAGKVALSGRLPLDTDPGSGAEVTGLAIQGDILAVNTRAAAGRSVDLALLNVAEKKGFPIGVVGDEAGAIALGPRQAYILDGAHLLCVPLFGGADARIAVRRLRPWFAEYAWQPDKRIAYDSGRVWISNGHKLVVMSDDLSVVLGEVVLPRPAIDMHVFDAQLCLVGFDPSLGVAQIELFDLGA